MLLKQFKYNINIINLQNTLSYKNLYYINYLPFSKLLIKIWLIFIFLNNKYSILYILYNNLQKINFNFLIPNLKTNKLL